MTEMLDDVDRVIVDMVRNGRRRGYSPSLEELGAAVGMTKAGASLRVRKLIERGILDRPGNRKRALVVKRIA